MEETQILKVMSRREKKKNFSFEWTQTPRYGEPR